ncbi:predicted protein [Sclerotinia sclerotiorum 1980 UF-70]|uniref:RING-type domain-containing protein n=1 Tax=Sclerotinia sclerotiorum (strain ATCC 18683 / 1980 / Ss-1) TaxID=665079 RepID=A7EWJ0_SCLS1|nr:predicted protein [Sclerotinia sclerotiorum 1980 UF-70]EDN93832.1 predicted protein [Sclerotinia sclerotiorum 1980 UF-70]
MALCLLRDVMIGNQWEAGMGQQHMRFIAAEAFDPVAHTLGDDEDCGLCREPLRDVEEQGVLVITHCNHVFHQKCLEESLKVSPNVDCPACKAELRGHNQAPQDIQGPDQISEFLTSFMTPEPQSFPSEQPITEQYLDQLDADVGEAIARVREADGDVRAIEREIEEVQQVELLGRPAGTRVKMTRNAQGVIDCVHLSCMMSYAPGEEIIDAGAMMLLRRRVMMEAIKAWAQTDCKVAVEARNRARQELAIRAEQANWIMTELLIEMTGWLSRGSALGSRVY